MTDVFVAGVALRAPGLPGWAASLPVLAGERPHGLAPIEIPPPSMLSPNERRRASLVTRLALAVAEEASAGCGLPRDALAIVFGSSNGDGATIGAILDALAGGDGQVSPTQFHNSVHNAPAGYWSIAVRSGQAATCLGCNDWTAAAALMKAVAEVRATRRPVLMCIYDAPLPEPLDAFRAMSHPFGMGLVLRPDFAEGCLARLSLRFHDQPPAPGTERPRSDALDRLGDGQPMARTLRLLEALAARQADTLSLAMLDGRIDIEVAPCPPHANPLQPCSTAPASRH